MNATLEPAILDQNGRPLVMRKPDPLPQSDVLSMAIDKGMDADGIAKLVDLIERRERQQAERDYTEALRTVSETAGVIIKSKQGSKSKYAPLDEINHIVTPLYTKAGLSLSFSEADCPFADNGWRRHVCDVRHTGGHKERYHLDLPLVDPIISSAGKEAMTAIQGAISTGSYVQRILLCRVFNLTIANTDLDGGRPAEPITAKQLETLKTWTDKFAEYFPKFQMGKFLKTFGGPDCNDPSQFTQAEYAEAVADLKQQLKGKVADEGV